MLSQLGRQGDWFRVAWAEGRFGWIPAAVTSTAPPEANPATLSAEVTLQPPMVMIDSSIASTDASTFRLRGILSDDAGVEDYYIWVTGQEDDHTRRVKVVYEHAEGARLDFEHEVPLFPGANRIAVIARDADRMTASDLVYIYRRTPGDTLSNAPEIE